VGRGGTQEGGGGGREYRPRSLSQYRSLPLSHFLFYLSICIIYFNAVPPSLPPLCSLSLPLTLPLSFYLSLALKMKRALKAELRFRVEPESECNSERQDGGTEPLSTLC